MDRDDEIMVVDMDVAQNGVDVAQHDVDMGVAQDGMNVAVEVDRDANVDREVDIVVALDDVKDQADDDWQHAHRHTHVPDHFPVHDENEDLFTGNRNPTTSVDDTSTSRNIDSTSPLDN